MNAIDVTDTGTETHGCNRPHRRKDRNTKSYMSDSSLLRGSRSATTSQVPQQAMCMDILRQGLAEMVLEATCSQLVLPQLHFAKAHCHISGCADFPSKGQRPAGTIAISLLKHCCEARLNKRKWLRHTALTNGYCEFVTIPIESTSCRPETPIRLGSQASSVVSSRQECSALEELEPRTTET